MPGAQPFRDDDVERLADRLGFGKAENTGRAAVPEADRAPGIGIDDRVRHAGDETLGELLRVEIHCSSPIPAGTLYRTPRNSLDQGIFLFRRRPLADLYSTNKGLQGISRRGEQGKTAGANRRVRQEGVEQPSRELLGAFPPVANQPERNVPCDCGIFAPFKPAAARPIARLPTGVETPGARPLSIRVRWADGAGGGGPARPAAGRRRIGRAR